MWSFMPAALIPLAHTIGTDFKPAVRRIPREQVLRWDRWEQND
ncbi:hypothetical protein [Streptomyces sp. 150FB]|nr:hypothetical protein [Streptomyces sp. 150FB]